MKPLDRLGKFFLVACALLFLVGIVFRLNGSSVFTWNGILRDPSSANGLLLGAPEEVRSDEWLVWTPAAMWQYEHNFPAENPSLGAGKAPFLYSLPVKHYTACFRPQLYGFFLFSFERGYAWYWNVKVFGLLASAFLLFWTLTRNSLLSLFGALWLFFSNYTQWWFSCPPMLPDMLSSWSLAMVAAISLLETRRWLVRLCATVGLVVAAVNFSLCLYPPFQLPLAYLWLLVFGAYALFRRVGEPQQMNWQSALCFAAALTAIASVLNPFFSECRPTFEMLSATAYPGRRRSHGGELSWLQLFSGVMNFFNSEAAYPDKFKQPNEAANFLPLWLPVLAVTARDLLHNPRKHAIAIASLGAILGFSFYALCPLPDWFCRATLLSYCTEVRALLVIGVANVIFVVTMLPAIKQSLAQTARRPSLIVGATVVGLTVAYLLAAEPTSPKFLVWPRMLTFIALNGAIVILLLTSRIRMFAVAVVALLGASNALVNPIMSGLDPLLNSRPLLVVRQLIQQRPTAAWAAYGSNPHSELLMAAGATVVSGVKTVPDLDFYKPADPEGQNVSAYNRYSFANFLFRRDRVTAGIRYLGFPAHLVSMHPLHAALRARNVQYFLFTQPFSNPEMEGIQLVRAMPEHSIWIYSVLPQPPLVLAQADS